MNNFKVVDKSTGEIRTVYAVRNFKVDSNIERVEFLMFDTMDRSWKWLKAREFEPYEE